MLEQFNRIKEISNLTKSKKDLSKTMNKFSEEFGELFGALNKLPDISVKKTNMSELEIKKEALSEIADCIQILFDISQQLGYSISDIENEINIKNDKWFTKYCINN